MPTRRTKSSRMGPDHTEVARTIWLPQPPSRVFTVVMDPEIAPLIDPSVRRWEPDRFPISVGTVFTIRGRFQWLPVRATSRVAVWEPPARGEFVSVKPRWPIQIHATHTFEPDGTGTKYTWSMAVHHPNLVGRLFTRLTSSLIDRTIAAQHRTLAAWLDQNPGSPDTPPCSRTS